MPAGKVRFPGPVPQIQGRGVSQYLQELHDWLKKLWSFVGHAATHGFSGLNPTDVTTETSPGTEDAGWAAGDHEHRFGILTDQGDLLTHNGDDPVRLPVGDEDDVLKVVSGVPAWTAQAGTVSGGLQVAVTLSGAAFDEATVTGEDWVTEHLQATLVLGFDAQRGKELSVNVKDIVAGDGFKVVVENPTLYNPGGGVGLPGGELLVNVVAFNI